MEKKNKITFRYLDLKKKYFLKLLIFKDKGSILY